MTFVRSLLAFSLLLSACYTPGQRYDTSYVVHVSPVFSAEQSELVTEAVNEWTARSNGELVFTIITDPAPATERGEIAFIPAHEGDLGYEDGDPIDGLTTREAYDYANSRVVTDGSSSPPDIFRHNVAHELGHAIGLPHAGHGTVMCAKTTCASLVVTCEDVMAWRALLGSTRQDCGSSD